MEEKKTHWKRLKNKTFLGAWDIDPGQMPDVTILRISKAMAKANQRAPEEEVDVIYFKEHPKGMILNSTHSDQITKVLRSPYIEDWIGKRIKLFVKSGIRKPGQKETIDAIRVSNTLPAPTPSEKRFLTPEMVETWENAIKAIKAGKSVEIIKKRYNLTKENEVKLLEYENEGNV